jgi:hypothetical protein
MITVIRTATAFPGMTGEAIVWANEVAALVKRVTGKEQFVCTSFGGMLADIAWIGQYDSVGQYDEMRSDLETRIEQAVGSIRSCKIDVWSNSTPLARPGQRRRSAC